ncbi:MAG TPA: HAD hydrolase-like protein [Acidothermaceae bacterium]
MHPRVVLFDLDGTLTASGPGITRSAASALQAVGRSPLDEAALLGFIGPPLIESFREIAGLDEAAVIEALVAYRSYFVERGMFENSVYPGIMTLLQELCDAGRRLAVTTSKPLPYAVPIIEHFALGGYFEGVFGPTADDDGIDKKAVVAHALNAMAIDDTTKVVLVGDRFHDVVGAHENGIACIGALWGYGAREELLAAGVDALAADADELAILLGLRA